MAGSKSFGLALALLCAACSSLVFDGRSFERTDWRVIAINGQDTPAQSGEYRMHFTNGRFSGGFGCNGMSAEYRVAGNQLSVGKTDNGIFHVGWITATERDCSMSPTGHFEDETRAILQEPMQIRPNGRDSIVLMSGPGTIVLKRLP